MVKIMAQHQQTLTNDQEQLSNNNNNADDGGGGGDDDLIDDNLQQQQYLESAQQTPKSPNIHQLEQDGKRTLIKNQLYLIEQLQLENANLRNERDQLQLENEELKFQLQMISSSNILGQSGAPFVNNQSLPQYVDATTNNAHGTTTHQTLYHLPIANLKTGAPVAPATNSNSSQNKINLLATPLRLPMPKGRSKSTNIGGKITDVPISAKIDDKENALQLPSSVRLSTSTSLTDCRQRPETIMESSSLVVGNKLLAGKSTNLTQFNVKNTYSSATTTSCNATTPHLPMSRNLPQDDDEQKVKLVEQLYGDSDKVQAAAIIIQKAFRKYQICKRFRTITEQLRHTSNQIDKKNSDQSNQSQSSDEKSLSDSDLAYASGTTRAAAWESLSQAADKLAAAAAAAKQQQQVATGLSATVVANSMKKSSDQTSQQQNALIDQFQKRQLAKQDQVVAAALNYQQLESIRKRQYRVGLNVFNKSPEKGISFLIAYSFIDSTSPFTKTSTSYYHSNQLHFIDSKQHLVQRLALPTNLAQNCQLCMEEDNLKRNVAHFLLHRKGLAKEKIGQYLGDLQAQFNQDVLKYYLQELEFNGSQIDLALRKFLSTFRLPGEAQKIEKIVDCFAQRYVECQQQQMTSNASTNNLLQLQQSQLTQNANPPQNNQTQTVNYKNNLILLTKDEIFILTFAIIMLNTDLHSPSLKPTSRMSASQFVNNLRGVFKSQSINESDLIEIYERVKANQITTLPDHVTHVMKVQQGLTLTNFQKKELPSLCVPHRRLVCFCRLFEVYDVNKKERVGQHQREIFLFNDLLLVTKLARRVRANITQMYTYRQSISLQGLYVELFQTTHYSFGIRLCQRSNDETIIMFNARNELDQSRFVDDLGESIAEMDEMETIKAHNIIETLHIKHQEKLKRHIMIHDDKFGIDVKFKDSDSIGESENKNPLAKDEMLKMIYNSDTRIETNYIKQINGQNEANKQQQALQQQLAQFF